MTYIESCQRILHMILAEDSWRSSTFKLNWNRNKLLAEDGLDFHDLEAEAGLKGRLN